MVDTLKTHRGARIASAIENAGFSQRQMATLIGVAPQSITKWIKTGNIQIENLLSLADITGVDFRYLIEGHSNGVREPGMKYNSTRAKLHSHANELTESKVKVLLLCADALAESDDNVNFSIQIDDRTIR